MNWRQDCNDRVELAGGRILYVRTFLGEINGPRFDENSQVMRIARLTGSMEKR